MTLKTRQELILRAVVEEYIASGAPVGSRRLSEQCGLDAAPSTIRNDLAELEELGLLAHPHTSAGRVPTDDGYRHYVDSIVAERRSHAVRPPLAAAGMISLHGGTIAVTRKGRYLANEVSVRLYRV